MSAAVNLEGILRTIVEGAEAETGESFFSSETAAALKIIANAVKIRLYRARQALRALLERQLMADANGLRVVTPISTQNDAGRISRVLHLNDFEG